MGEETVSMRYFIGFLVAIGLLILAIILIIRGFSGGGVSVSTKTPLTNFASTNTVMQMVIDGPVNVDQNHYQLQMTVGQNLNTMTLYQGYQGTSVKTDTYPSNSAAYGEFLRSLQLAGYTHGDTSSSATTDPRGFCPFGERYTLEIVNGSGQDVQRFWATSCGNQGTFKGNLNTVLQLFQAQFPGYNQIISNTDLF